MKKKLSLFLVAFLAVFASSFAEPVEKDVTYALTEGDTFTSGQTVEVKNGTDVVATITYGEDGGEAFKAAKADKNIEGFTAFTEGNGTNGNKTGGTWYTITPKFDGTIEVAVALNADKAFYILEDGTALADYNGITVSAKYYGTYKFTAKADKSYKIYCAGSKLGFYGFKYNYAVDDDDPTPAETKTIYMRPGVWASDAQASTRYAVYAFNVSTEGNQWFDMTEVKDDEGTFTADIPENYEKIILVRMNGATTENNWDNKWNQTADIDFSNLADKTLFTISSTTWGEEEEGTQKTPYEVSTYTGPVVKYHVSVAEDIQGGSIGVDPEECAAGTAVTVYVKPGEDLVLNELYYIGETSQSKVDIVDQTFNMPEENVTVFATFKEKATQEVTSTYIFTTAKWTATLNGVEANWTSEKDGAGFNNDGVQVTANGTGANATSPVSFDNVSKIVVTYNTNKSAGAGTLDVQIGDNEAVSKDWAYSGSEDGRTAKFTAEFTYDTPQTGYVNLKANTTTNSIYVVSVAITHTGGDEPQPADIKTLAINGEFPGMSWNPEEGIAMQPEATAAGLWTLELKNVTVEGKQYDYKAFADGKTDGYQLPAQGNNNWVFGTDEYPAGTYDLLFTANTSTNELTLAPTYVGPNTIAQLNALANKKAFTFTGNAIVVAKMKGESSQTIDNYIYIKDETGSSLIYDQGGAHSNESDKTKGLLVGDVITAPWNGTVSIYKNLFEVRPAGDEQLTASENVGEVTYPEATPDDVTAENVNKVVEIKGLTIYNVDGKNIKFTIGDDLVNGWNQFGIELPEVTEGKTFDVVGAISRYNDNIQFQPIKITEVVAPVEDVYSVAGSSEALFGSEWNEKEGNEMTLTEGKYTWTKEKVAVPAGDVKFKVVKNHSWNENWPKDDYVLNIPETAEYTVTITFDEETKAITAEATKTGEAQIDDVVVLAGEEAICGSSWNDKDEANMMAQSPTAANLYTITKKGLSLNKGTYQYKVVLNGTWYPEGTDNNMRVVIENSGIYDIEFTFNKETKEMNAVPTKTGEPSTFTVTFKTDRQWEKVYAYTFDPEMNGEWPGDGEGIQKLDEGVYTYTCVAAVAPGFIIFNDGTSGEGHQSPDYAFENGNTYSLTTEKTTAYVGDPEEAISATTGIEIPAATCVYAGVQAEKIIRIVAKDIAVAAPARGLDNTVTEGETIPFTVTKKDGTLLVEDKDITVTDDPGSGGKAYEFTVSPDASTEVTTNGFIIKPKDEKNIAVTAIEVEKAKAPAPVADIVYDFAAEQALIAAGTITKPTNVGGSAANGQAFFGWESSSKTDSKRQDYKGYGKVEGSTLPDECHIWRRSDRFDQDASWNVTGGVTMPNDREFVIDGLTPGSKVVIEYDATNATEGNKEIIWATGDGSSEGLSLRAAATIGGAEAVSGETAIPSGAEILVTKVTPAEKGSGYIVVKVKRNMVISKISVTVNEDAKAYAVNVSDAIENGTVKVSRPTAYAGDEVVVTATPAEGYKLDAITVTGVNTNEAVVVTDGKFTMPADDVTVSATFAEKLDYYLVGNMTDWKPNAEYKLTANTAAEGVEYMITVDLDADAQFKIAKSNGTTIADTDWYPDGMGNSYGENGELAGAGKYTVYFRPNADGGDDWFYHVIFVQKFYNITVVNCDGMTITPEVTEATAGTKVWATVAMTEGYEPEFPGFTNTDTGDVIEMTEGTDVGMDETGKVWIIMPAQNLTIKAKASKVYRINLDLSQENGSATCISVNKDDPTTFYKKEGKEIYLDVRPGAGYTADITVTAGEDPVEVIAEAGTYHEQAYTHKFIMPAKDVTVKVTFTKSTGINGIDAEDADDNTPIYNLSGQKVTKSYKGVVIKNGKKYMQK